MRTNFLILLAFLIFFILPANTLFAQRKPDPNTGNTKFRRQGIMDGNLVRTIFINWGEVSHWPDQPSCEWPKGSGHSYVDGVALVVQSRTIDRNGKVIYPMETQYREFVDTGPNDELWGWGPVPGYFNTKGEDPAMSDDPNTWPVAWPDKMDDTSDPGWRGKWNGFFGKNIKNADLETYFVFDDDPDEEWDFYPDPTNPERRGLGLEVATRLFQWSQVLAEDVVFAIYSITNEGKTDYDSTFYVFYIDWGVGGTDDSSDDTGNYDLLLDLAWAWDYNGFGSPGNWSPVGVVGFAFLESPGIDNDVRDNDSDGIINESRVSGAGSWLETYPYGITDPQAYLNYYPGRELRPHWSGDEDIDWKGFEDLNENGVWDAGEPVFDDVGKDGLSPYDPDYIGPDEGEADGRPTPGEPNFDYLDKDESDQIGLTGFEIFPVHTPYELWNENQNWRAYRSSPQPKDALQVTANLAMYFSSGPFPLKAGQTENYSMSLIFGEDVDDLARTKKTVQQIYNADYRFAKPPDKPRLTVIPGDGQVILKWDDKAELSWDPFLQEFDFEGYKIYRSTEAEFLEARKITDAYGRLTFKKPIAQFDLKNSRKGLHPIDVEGVKYNLGDDTGLKHLYVDKDVQNGQTYYYAVVSYDRGLIDTSATGAIEGISPSECANVIKVDQFGNVETDLNTAFVTPNVYPAGYSHPGIKDNIEKLTIGTGDFSSENIHFILSDSIRDSQKYEITFRDTSLFHNQGIPFYTIYRVAGENKSVIVPEAPMLTETLDTPMFDGMVIDLNNPQEVKIDWLKTGVVVGYTNYKTFVQFDPRFSSETNPSFNINIPYPADYEIRFSDTVVDTSNDGGIGSPKAPVKFAVWNITENKPAKFLFRDVVKDCTLTPDTTESIVIYVDNNLNKLKISTTWQIIFEKDTQARTAIPPQPGTILRIATTKPYRTGDYIRFTTTGARYDQEQAKSDLDNIDVVPNPYIVGASWETRSPFKFGRGEHRIYFINLPERCTIRIYTVRGYLVDTIEHYGNSGSALGLTTTGAATWDLVSKDGQDIAYGVYLYHIEAPEVGEKTGKFAVIK
ncbi:hypothetical protein JW964_15565 [candidate division KSB1 bacterium]|nr:hypothetical protein [candidate division KSB1 bacterium]